VLNYNGPDQFTFKVNDGVTDSPTAVVSITVRPINDPPVARIAVAPLVTLLPGQTELLILSPNNSNALVRLDGSQSSDAENDLLAYHWLADGGVTPFATGERATNQFDVGTHIVTLLVSDSAATGSNAVTLEIITPGEAVALLITQLSNADLARRNTRPFFASLKATMASFDRGQFDAGVNQLQAFQNKASAQIAPSDPALAAALIATAQKIIDAVSSR